MKSTGLVHRISRGGLSVACAVSLVLVPFSPAAFGQSSDLQQQPTPLLSPAQLDNLVAPIALYPDPLLGQVLAASTYPLEIVEAQQWLQQNSNLQRADLMNAAKQQNWDPSVQALVAFPDALSLLNRDVRWTSDLGNAFLAQQKDVMDAVQRMRVRAQQNGRLASTPQQTVTTQIENGQDAVVIEPASPQVIYVPVYNPEYIWGPPVWGYYPPLWYPTIGFGFGFGPGIFLGGFFPGWAGWGWGGWGPGWGWCPGWFGGGLFVNNFFFGHFGFHEFNHGGFIRRNGFAGGRAGWEHDPLHRAGVPYANHSVATRFNNARFAAGRTMSAGRSFSPGRLGETRGFGGSPATTARGNAAAGGGWQHFNGGGNSGARGFAPSTAPSNRAGAFNSSPGRSFSGGGPGRSLSAPGQSYRGYSAPRNYSAPSRSFSAPHYSAPSRGFSAPHYSAPSRSFSSPRSFGGGGGGHSFSGGGGHSFGGGGGHSSGGGGHSGGGHGGHR